MTELMIRICRIQKNENFILAQWKKMKHEKNGRTLFKWPNKAKERHKWVKSVYLKVHEFEKIKYPNSNQDEFWIKKIISLLKSLAR